MKNLAVLGATGSIGRSTLNLVRNDPEKFNVFSLVANSNVSDMKSLILEFSPNVVVMNEPSAAKQLRENLNGDINLKFFKNKDGVTAYDRQQELLRNVRIGGLTLDENLRQVINSEFYKRLGEPTQVDKNNKERGGKVKYLTRIIKDYHKLAEMQIMNERRNFFSTEDPTGKFTLDNSIKNLGINKQILQLGTSPNLKALEGLYKFSQ